MRRPWGSRETALRRSHRLRRPPPTRRAASPVYPPQVQRKSRRSRPEASGWCRDRRLRARHGRPLLPLNPRAVDRRRLDSGRQTRIQGLSPVPGEAFREIGLVADHFRATRHTAARAPEAGHAPARALRDLRVPGLTPDPDRPSNRRRHPAAVAEYPISSH